MPAYRIRFSKGSSRENAIIAVVTLNMKCARATRFLPAAPWIAPINTVLVVPRPAPIAMAAAVGSSITPVCNAVSVTIIVAELDCTIAAKATPNKRYCQPTRFARRPTSIASLNEPTLFFISERPMSKKPSAARIRPNSAMRPFRPTRIREPNPISGSATFSRSSLNPSVITTQPVKVVPRFAPKITPSAFSSEMMLAPTNASTIRPTNELLWTSPVATVPTATEFNGLSV